MEIPKFFVVATIFSSSLLLLSRANGLADGEQGSNSHNAYANRRTGVQVEWQTLTKRNFSTQIRLHPHLLLMVTLPWSGESRSLMKEVAHQVSDKQENLGRLRLMVLYRNSEKMLADVLGASEGITLFCYHHLKSFKYQGRLRAQNILSSVFHLMSLPSEEFPLKPLNSEEEVENFIRSTDKAVLLLEFCGWSARLLNQKNDESKEHSLSVQSLSENGVILGENLTREADGTIPFGRKKNQKTQGLENEDQTCGGENELNSTPWLGGVTWANESTSLGFENGRDGADISCTLDEFQHFQSFFSKFIAIAIENFLPPERQRYGLISKRSLVPFLGAGNPETWLLILQFSGCPNCSKVFREGDDLRMTLQMPHPIVVELGGDQSSQDAALPANRPSVILFIDRSSELLEVREKSKSALDVFRKFAQHIQLSNQMIRRHHGDIFKGFSMHAYPGTQSITEPYGHMAAKVSRAPRVVKFKDNMAFMIIKEGESVSLDNMADDFKDNPAYDFLANLLDQKNPVWKPKETKISLLAKEVGFQLLSDDFEVQVVDSMTSDEENDRSSSMITSVVTRSEDPSFEIPLEAVEHYVNLKNGDSLNAASLTTVKDGKQPELIVKTSIQHHQEAVLDTKSNTKLISRGSAQEAWKSELVVASSTGVNEDDNRCTEMEFGLPRCQAENSFHLEQDTPTTEENNENDNVHHTDCNLSDTCSLGFAQNSSHDDSSEALVRDDVTEEKYFQVVGKLNEEKYQHHAFISSFFFSDGGYQLLGELTEGSIIPSVVILDPVKQLHYVLSDETSYSSLVAVFDKFLNGSLTPYWRSELVMTSPRETPRPPFVNLDFHEADSIPRVTADKFSELVLGFEHCDWGNKEPSSNNQNLVCARKRDVLVLFSNSWCGFCQRMEMVVREVYRTLKGFMSMLKSGSMNREFMPIQDNSQDVTLNEVPSIFYMDCTLNDCSSVLKHIGKREIYPTLVLFPAEKEAISYEGDMSVVDVIEFVTAHGCHSRYLNGYKGILWTQARKGSRDALHDVSTLTVHGQTPVTEDYHEFLLEDTVIRRDNHLLAGSHTVDESHVEGPSVVIGSVLTATDRLLSAFPFDKSSILIVTAEQNEGFQGLIMNKRINWDVFKELDEEFEPLKQAPLFYGGPVRAHGLPLVSLARKPLEEYSEVPEGLYFGNSFVTSLAVAGIKSGNQSATDYWFFLGYSSWEWNQLFDELAEGAWNLSNYRVGHLDWPES